jgi:hypothetical protein
MKLKALLLSFFVLYSGTCQADCGEYFASKSRLENSMKQLLWNYKGTASSLLACAATCKAQQESDQGMCALALCGGACLFIGIDVCANFFIEMSTLDSQREDIEAYGRAQGCIS